MIINILSVIVLPFLACGFVFAILFVVNGVKILDPAANNSPIGFRLIIIPGILVFWPLLLAKWMRTYRRLTNQSTHFDAGPGLLQLRKRQVQCWIILAFAIPAGFLSASLVIPSPMTSTVIEPHTTVALPLVLRSLQKNGYTINLRVNVDRSMKQLEWINNIAITVPSAIIYQTQTGNLDGAEIIGRVESRGTYRFPLKAGSISAVLHFIVYDIIHHQTIDQINL
jgi:hypothetical protein